MLRIFTDNAQKYFSIYLTDHILEKFDKDDRQIQEKPLEGFRKLTELKNSGPGPRVFIYRGKNEKPTVVGFCMRNDLDGTIKKLKNKGPFNLVPCFFTTRSFVVLLRVFVAN